MLPVYQSLPAPPATAAWLRARLEPVIKACKFAHPIPLEIRPTGRASGYCEWAGGGLVKDRRVCISSKVVFWSRDRLPEVHLHECAHRLLEGCEVADHGPEFFALTAILYSRGSSFFDFDALGYLSIYDLQDVADIDKGCVLNWALALAKELAPTEINAEKLASVVCLAWAQNVKDTAAKKLQIEREKTAQINLKLEVKNINTKLFLWGALSTIG